MADEYDYRGQTNGSFVAPDPDEVGGIYLGDRGPLGPGTVQGGAYGYDGGAASGAREFNWGYDDSTRCLQMGVERGELHPRNRDLWAKDTGPGQRPLPWERNQGPFSPVVAGYRGGTNVALKPPGGYEGFSSTAGAQYMFGDPSVRAPGFRGATSSRFARPALDDMARDPRPDYYGPGPQPAHHSTGAVPGACPGAACPAQRESMVGGGTPAGCGTPSIEIPLKYIVIMVAIVLVALCLVNRKPPAGVPIIMIGGPAGPAGPAGGIGSPPAQKSGGGGPVPSCGCSD